MEVASTTSGREAIALAQDELLDSFAVYVRGLGITDANQFRRLLDEAGIDAMDYRQGNSPRLFVAEGVYTSTEYPPAYEISLHNEMSYATTWPSMLYFCCLVPPSNGGATHLADAAQVLRSIEPGTRERFIQRGVRYQQNLHSGSGLGKSWQETYGKDGPAALESYLRAAAIEFEWRPDGTLRTWQIRQATRVHPVRGVEVWFNQAEQWHVSGLPAAEADALREIFDSDDEFPLSATFGDGSPIPLADLQQVRAAALANAVDVPWCAGDLLVVDNMAAMHGRRAYSGARRVLVAMS